MKKSVYFGMVLMALIIGSSCGRRPKNNVGGTKPVIATSQSRDQSVRTDEGKPRPAKDVQSGVAKAFDFEAWKKKYGKRITIKEWNRYNPKPFRGRFGDGSSVSMAKKWYIMLGPLGVCTLMHDKLWYGFSGFDKIYPEVLRDGAGPMFNCFEVTLVQPGSPTDGHLKKGDLILEIDDTPLKTAGALRSPKKESMLSLRGIEMQAGELIDKAEGRGNIRVKVLRLPPGFSKSHVHYAPRSWQVLQRQKYGTPLNINLTAEAGKLLRVNYHTDLKSLRKKRMDFNLKLRDENGAEIIFNAFSGEVMIPRKGHWTLSGSIGGPARKSYTIETAPVPVMPPELKQYVRNVEFEIPRIGSFGKNYDPRGIKERNISRIMSYRLAVQQDDDGGWSGASTYATPAFYSSICGLALMSTGDSVYSENIRKAACFVAEHPQSNWSYARGMRLVFLAEYYLRTHDADILEGLKKHVQDALVCVLCDYTAGHGVTNPGYGGSGYIGGGSVIALGLSIADKGGVLSETQRQTVRRMLARAQQLAPSGVISYGRSGGAGKYVSEEEALHGQGKGCSTGPYYLGSLIGDGAARFARIVARRYTTPPYGDTEGGHAVQTIHFFWGELSILNSSEQEFLKNMTVYLWKFVTYRNFDGFANRNNTSMEYHGGDGVIGEPYWRTAAFVILFNAYRHNLAITGKKEFQTSRRRDIPYIGSSDARFYNFVKRNWAVAEVLLGQKAPMSFRRTWTAIRGLPQQHGIIKNLLELLNRNLPRVAADVSALPGISKDDKRKILQLIYGMFFEVTTTAEGMADTEDDLTLESISKKQHSGKKISAKKEKKLQRKAVKKRLSKGKVKGTVNYTITLRPMSIVDMNAGLKQGDSDADFPALSPKGTVGIFDPSGKYIKRPLIFNFDTYIPKDLAKRERKQKQGALTKTFRVDLDSGEKVKLLVKFSYSLGGVPLLYAEPLVVPTSMERSYNPVFCQVWLPGIVAEDYYANKYDINLMLPTKRVIACNTRAFTPPAIIPAGTPCRFLIAPQDTWEHDLRDIKVLKPQFRVAIPTGITISGCKYSGKPAALTGVGMASGITIKNPPQEFSIEESFVNQETLEFFELVFNAEKLSGLNICVEVWQKGGWHRLASTFIKQRGWQSHRNPRVLHFVPTSGKRFRVRLEAQGVRNLRLDKAVFYKSLPESINRKLQAQPTW